MMISPSLSDHSKVWLYYSHRPLNSNDSDYINSQLSSFCEQWQAHQQNLKATFSILHQRFIVLVVDENPVSASGCSIDKSVNELKRIGTELAINFFERSSLFYLQKNELVEIKFNELPLLLEHQAINDDTVFIDTTIDNLGKLRTEFEKKLKDIWFYKRIKTIHI